MSVFKFVSHVATVNSAIEDAMKKALFAAGNVGRNRVVQNIGSGTRSGHTYRVPGTGTYYTASAPGEYPAVRTGILKGSIHIKEEKHKVLVGTDVEYGLTLERGGGPGARPWLKRSLDEVEGEMKAKLAQRWF